MQYWTPEYNNRPYPEGRICHRTHHLKPSQITTELITFATGDEDNNIQTEKSFLTQNEDGLSLIWTDADFVPHVLANTTSPGVPVANLNDLLDVNIIEPKLDGQTISWDSTLNKFTNDVRTPSTNIILYRYANVTPGNLTNDEITIFGDYIFCSQGTGVDNLAYKQFFTKKIKPLKCRITLQSLFNTEKFVDFVCDTTPSYVGGVNAWNMMYQNTTAGKTDEITNNLPFDNDELVLFSFSYLPVIISPTESHITPIFKTPILIGPFPGFLTYINCLFGGSSVLSLPSFIGMYQINMTFGIKFISQEANRPFRIIFEVTLPIIGVIAYPYDVLLNLPGLINYKTINLPLINLPHLNTAETITTRFLISSFSNDGYLTPNITSLTLDTDTSYATVIEIL